MLIIKLMQLRDMGLYFKLTLLSALFALGVAGTAMAVSTESQNFQVTEPEFGAGAALETCSGQYCAKASIGEVSSGEASSASKTADFGNVATGSEPLLEVIVEDGESNLGVLGVDKTATKTVLVKIRTYLSDGYYLQIHGDPPKYDGYTMQTPSTPTDSTQGTEQFAINAVANTAPEVGADPVQTPSSSISFGYVEDDYSAPNKFKYESGDVVARSDTETGQTDYTISMIVNVGNSTPAGHFTGDFAAVVIPVF